MPLIAFSSIHASTPALIYIFALPAFDEQCTQELVLLRHFQRILLVRIIFHVYRQLFSGPKVVRHPSGFFCIEEMIDVDIYAFERL
jgi:hypothetical protein